MRARTFLIGCSSLFVAGAAQAHDLNKKENVFFIDSPWVERAWAEGEFRIQIDLLDTPGPASPTPQTGFLVKLPGVKLNFYDRLEVGLDVPFIFNPDTFKGDIPVADPAQAQAGLKAPADFDMPSVDAYAKFSLVKDKKAKTQAAIGFEGKVGINNDPTKKAFDGLDNLRNPFMTPYELQLRPFFAAAVAKKNFGPQLSVGFTAAQDQQRPATDPNDPTVNLPKTDLWVDWGVSVPYYNTFTEMAVVVGASGRHLLSGLSTPFDDHINVDAGILFGGSSSLAEFGFIAQIPVFSQEYRDFETFSVRFIYTYNLTQLTFKKKEEEKKDETKDGATSAPASAPTK